LVMAVNSSRILLFFFKVIIKNLTQPSLTLMRKSQSSLQNIWWSKNYIP
jgi:hypothetical protein